MARSTERLRQTWSGLEHEGSAALTPGRVVVSGLLSGYFSGMLAGSRQQDRETLGPHDSGQGFPMLPALLQLGSALLPHVLPSLAPAFRAGVAAGAGRETEAPQAAQSEGDA